MKKHNIITISVDDSSLQDIDSICEEMGFKGRSETIRAGVRALHLEKKEREKLRGKINATLTVVHNHARNMVKTSHEYQEVITSHLHNHLDNDKCLEIFILQGHSNQIKRLVEKFQRNKKVEQIKLTVC